jgi:hypothetical protein
MSASRACWGRTAFWRASFTARGGRGRLLADTTVAELSAGSASLEDAFFRLTSEAVEYQGNTANEATS